MPSLQFAPGFPAPPADPVAVLARPGDDAAEVDLPPELAQHIGAELAAALRRDKAKGKAGDVTPVAPPAGATPDGLPSGLTYVAGVGDSSARALRRAGASLARRARGSESLTVSLQVPGAALDGEQAAALVEGLLLGSYTFRRIGKPPEHEGLATITLVGEEPDGPRTPPMRQAQARAAATCFARDLGNTPAGSAGPADLVQAAVQAAGDRLGVRVWDAADLAAEGFGGILAVGAGSERPPYLVQLSYAPETPAPETSTTETPVGLPHVVLVGKGVTFDSGGLSLKPRETMPLMKTDMSGAAAVMAVMRALPDSGLRLRVTALLPLAENVPSGSAYRPGDVIRHYGGTTVEVLNTDAEGRLLLADALAYADAVLDPDVVVDVATLTGAATLALSRRHGALFTADEGLAEEFAAAGLASGESVWRMPLIEEYRQALRSEVADLCHVTRDPSVSAGAITAALFLQTFAGSRRWAHLDIAGPARAEGDDGEISKGATGFGARLLLRWLEACAAR